MTTAVHGRVDREGRGGILTFKWLTGLLVTLVLGLTVSWANRVHDQLQAMERRVDAREEQITALLSAVATLQVTAANNSVRLDRMENKLDRLLERGR